MNLKILSKITGLWICFFSVIGLYGQNQVSVHGKFLIDTLKAGLPLQYVLTARHPSDVELIFPDSSYNYQSFEWISKTYFPTKTVNNLSTDSVIYKLVSYELQNLQSLRLPVFVIQDKDCTAVFSEEDTLFFKSSLDSTGSMLKSSTDYEQVVIIETFNKNFIVTVAIIVLAGLIWILFGRRIRRGLRLYQMSLQHRGFAGSFDRLQRRLKQENTAETVESAVVLWKEYMEALENKPFSTYTSKEILNQIPDEGLAEALKEIDRIVYGQAISAQAASSLQVLEDISLTHYRQMRETVKKEYSS
jgi:hypothetical protein